ncbi:hypothetical protein D044_2285B, partial [Vibrio parahaemolyticus EKP-026]
PQMPHSLSKPSSLMRLVFSYITSVIVCTCVDVETVST